MAKNNKVGKTATIENSTITLDFVEAYKKFNEDTCTGTMEIPVEVKEKNGLWSKVKAFFTKK